jgi:hypothetical protein
MNRMNTLMRVVLFVAIGIREKRGQVCIDYEQRPEHKILTQGPLLRENLLSSVTANE